MYEDCREFKKWIGDEATIRRRKSIRLRENTRKPTKETRPPLRQFMMDGEFSIGATLGTTLTKLALRYGDKVTRSKRNKLDTEVMLTISIIHLGKSDKVDWITIKWIVAIKMEHFFLQKVPTPRQLLYL